MFNDCGIAIEAARKVYGLRRVAYVDIDAHHGDGVFYAFERDPDVAFADLHEDGRFLYPGTGSRAETGRGAAEGTKLNVPMPPGAGDEAFVAAWEEVERYRRRGAPGADPAAMRRGLARGRSDHAPRSTPPKRTRMRRAGSRRSRTGTRSGRLLAMGGGGYNRANLARAWTRVVEELAA